MFLITVSESSSGCQNTVVAQRVMLISATPHIKHIDEMLIKSEILQWQKIITMDDRVFHFLELIQCD